MPTRKKTAAREETNTMVAENTTDTNADPFAELSGMSQSADLDFDHNQTATTSANAGGSLDFDTELDLSEYGTEIVYEPLDAGNYDLTVKSVKPGYAQTSGNPQLAWTYTTMVDGKERYLFNYTQLTPEQLPRTKKAIIVCIPDFNFAHLVPSRLNDQLVGKTCRAKVAIRVDEKGQKNNQIKELMPSELTGDSFFS